MTRKASRSTVSSNPSFGISHGWFPTSGEMEVQGHEDPADGGEHQHAQKPHPRRVGQARPAREPDDAAGDQRVSDEQLAHLDQDRERSRIRDHRPREEAPVEMRLTRLSQCPGRLDPKTVSFDEIGILLETWANIGPRYAFA